MKGACAEEIVGDPRPLQPQSSTESSNSETHHSSDESGFTTTDEDASGDAAAATGSTTQPNNPLKVQHLSGDTAAGSSSQPDGLAQTASSSVVTSDHLQTACVSGPLIRTQSTPRLDGQEAPIDEKNVDYPPPDLRDVTVVFVETSSAPSSPTTTPAAPTTPTGGN